MATAATIAAKLILDATKYFSGLDDAKKKSDDFSKKMTSMGTQMIKTGAIMTAGLTAPIVAGLKSSVDAASNLEQSIGGIESVFGDAGKAITDFGLTAANEVGLSMRSFNDLSVRGGALLQNLGFDATGAADEMVKLAQRGSDVAATFGGPVENVLNAVNSALKGEFNPLEQFGVKMNAADITARALEMGLGDLNGEVDNAAKAQAALAIFYEQTAKTQGQFARESDTLAGQQERLKANFENVSATLGTQLLPLGIKLMEMISGLIDRFTALSPAQQKTILVILGIVAAIGPLITIIGTLMTVIGAVTALINTGVIGTIGAFIVAFWPVIAVIAAVIAVVILLKKAWENNWGGIQDKTKEAVAWVTTNITEFIDTVSGLWDDIINKFDDIDWVQLGKDIINGLINGLKSMASMLWNTVGEIASGVADFFSGLLGIESPSKIFFGYGENIMKGLALGIRASSGLPMKELTSSGVSMTGGLSNGGSSSNTMKFFGDVTFNTENGSPLNTDFLTQVKI